MKDLAREIAFLKSKIKTFAATMRNLLTPETLGK